MATDQIIEKVCKEYEQDAYAMYLRKSRADLELEAMGEGETLARHRKQLYDLAAKHGIHPDQITVYEEIVSGESLSSRPEVQRLLSDVYAKRYKGVLVVEVERLARGNTKDQGEVADAFQYSSTHILTPAKVYDPNNEFDQEYFEFGLFMSRREYKTIRRRMEAGKLQSVQEGNYIGAANIFGFDIVRASKRDRYLVEKPEESQYVKMIFDWFTKDRLGVGEIARRLTLMGLPTPTGKSKDWNRGTIKDILQNPHYIGKIRWKNREMSKEYADGKMVNVNRRNKADSWQVYEGKHDGFISEEQYNLAQQLFNEATPVKLDLKVVNPLAGIICCKECGKTLRYQGYTTLPNTTPRYAHPESLHCKKKSLPMYQVIETVVETLKRDIADCELKMQSDSNKAVREHHLQRIAAVEAELAKQEKRRDGLFDKYDAGDYTRDEFIERKQKYIRVIEELKQQLADLKASTPEFVDYSERITTLYSLIDCIKDPTIDGKAKNDYLKQYIERIDYDVEDYGDQRGGKALLDIILK